MLERAATVKLRENSIVIILRNIIISVFIVMTPYCPAGSRYLSACYIHSAIAMPPCQPSGVAKTHDNPGAWHHSMPGIDQLMSLPDRQTNKNWHVRDAKEVKLLSAAIIEKLAPKKLATFAELVIFKLHARH
jgi:hypothetical protein